MRRWSQSPVDSSFNGRKIRIFDKSVHRPISSDPVVHTARRKWNQFDTDTRDCPPSFRRSCRQWDARSRRVYFSSVAGFFFPPWNESLSFPRKTMAATRDTRTLSFLSRKKKRTRPVINRGWFQTLRRLSSDMRFSFSRDRRWSSGTSIHWYTVYEDAEVEVLVYTRC